MKLVKWICAAGWASIFTLQVACVSKPKYEYDDNTDVRAELNMIERDLKKAQEEQYDVFAPFHFRSSGEAWETATKAFRDKADRDYILAQLGDARGYANKVFEKGKKIKTELLPIADARAAAIRAGALHLNKEQLELLDKELKDLTNMFETKMQTKISDKEMKRVQSYYLDLEQNTLKKNILGMAAKFIEVAAIEGAAEFAPKMLKDVQEKYDRAERAVESYHTRHRAYKHKIHDVTEQARELLKMTLIAKQGAYMSPATLAKEISTRENDIEEAVNNNNTSLTQVGVQLLGNSAEGL